MVYNP